MAPHASNELFFDGDKDEFDPSNYAGAVSNGSNGAKNNSVDGQGIGDTSSPSLPKRHPETGIDVLIAGAGMAGLMAALECWRKGHNVVRILERNDGPVYTGDQLNIQPSAFNVFRHWPDMQREIEEEQYDPGMCYKKHNGDHIYGPGPPSFNDPENKVGRKGPHVGLVQNRVKFYKTFLRQVARVGFKVDYGKRVKEYVEDVAAGKGGVVLESGEVYVADIVIAADGLKTRSGKLTTGENLQTRPSGMAIYRTAYPTSYAMSDELVRERWGKEEGGPFTWEFWLGPGMHAAVFLSQDVVSWGLTHRDAGTAEESWDPDVQPEEVLKVMETVPGWHPALYALIKTSPPKSIVHWPLIWRDLTREWTSPGGHVVQIGDAAHSFLPSSGNGATQALEDAVTLATCLQLSGARNAAMATKIFNLLRYERISCAQKMAFVNAQIKQATNWQAIEEDPSRIRSRFPRWVYQHDPEAYAYEKYGQAFAHLVAGEPFQNTNYPPGHKFVPWTIDEVMSDIKNGKSIEDLLDGDWS